MAQQPRISSPALARGYAAAGRLRCWQQRPQPGRPRDNGACSPRRSRGGTRPHGLLIAAVLSALRIAGQPASDNDDDVGVTTAAEGPPAGSEADISTPQSAIASPLVPVTAT